MKSNILFKKIARKSLWILLTQMACWIPCKLAENIKRKKWIGMDAHEFNDIFLSEDDIQKTFTKQELLVCLGTMSDKLKSANIKYAISWKRDKLVSFYFKLTCGQLLTDQTSKEGDDKNSFFDRCFYQSDQDPSKKNSLMRIMPNIFFRTNYDNDKKCLPVTHINGPDTYLSHGI